MFTSTCCVFEHDLFSSPVCMLELAVCPVSGHVPACLRHVTVVPVVFLRFPSAVVKNNWDRKPKQFIPLKETVALWQWRVSVKVFSHRRLSVYCRVICASACCVCPEQEIRFSSTRGMCIMWPFLEDNASLQSSLSLQQSKIWEVYLFLCEISALNNNTNKWATI